MLYRLYALSLQRPWEKPPEITPPAVILKPHDERICWFTSGFT